MLSQLNAALLLFALHSSVLAQAVTLSVDHSSIHQYEPVAVLISVHNTTAVAIDVSVDVNLVLERQAPNGSWESVTPWPAPSPWQYDQLSSGRLPRETLHVEPGAQEYVVFSPLITPALLAPGAYRLLPVSMSTENGSVSTGQPVTFTVIAHVQNAQEVAGQLLLLGKLYEGDFDAAVVAFAQSILSNPQTSEYLRALAAVQLGHYYSASGDWVACATSTSQVAASLGVLPCGGLGPVASFLSIRAGLMQCSTKSAWDAIWPQMDALLQSYPALTQAYSLLTFSGRRDVLQ